MHASGLVLFLAVVACLGPAQSAHAAGTPFALVPCPDRRWVNELREIAPLPGARVHAGRYAGGSYLIEIPGNWNGELVLWAHGTVDPDRPGGRRLQVQIPALRNHWIERGFAWAASSYRCNGLVAGVGLVDTMALRDLVQEVSGGQAPVRTYLAGSSLGGRITMLGLREFPSDFDGGLAQCPTGQETSDVRVAIASAAEWLTGIPLRPATLDQDLSRMRSVLGQGTRLTTKGRQLASIQISLTGGPRPFASEGLLSRFLDNIRLGVTSVPEAVVGAATNVGIVYDVAEGLGLSPAVLNARVPRRKGNPELRSRTGPYRELAPFDGRISRPLLTIHGTGDLQVPVSQEQAFRRAAAGAGREPLLVQRLMRIPGHCRFSHAEQTRAFDDLVEWVRTGVRPGGDNVMGDLSDAGLTFTNPRRLGDPGGLR